MLDVARGEAKNELEVLPLPSETPKIPARIKHVALIGNFPPRRCGIATFTADVYDSLRAAAPGMTLDVIAMNDGETYDYPDAVRAEIRQDEIDDYLSVARRLNADKVDLVCVQHEYGIFGGAAGGHLLTLLQAVRAPVVTTLHTVLEQPNADQMRVMRALLRRSARVIVMAERGREILQRVYGADAAHVAVIPHGAPDRALQSTGAMKTKLGLAGREVLMTFGLLSPNKGLESVIRALPEIVRARPNALYLIVGATHPALVRRDGESYRESLQALAEELGVGAHVRYVNAYLDTDELLDHLAAADIYVTPYLNEAQITSGTLAYAVAMGKPIVSTPYWHAAEALANDVGVLVDFNDAAGFARAIAGLLSDDVKREGYRRRAYEAGRATTWPRSARAYLSLFTEAAVDEPRPARILSAPAPSLAAVQHMSDDCGMLQHGVYAIADRAHGYCVDDNARALILIQKLRALGMADEQAARLERAYAAFVQHAWNDGAGRFRNFMSYARTWCEEIGSDDSNGRTFWSLGETVRGAADPALREWALSLAHRTAPRLADLKPMRTRAFLMLGADAVLDREPYDDTMLRLMRDGAEAILGGLHSFRAPGWRWPEQVLAYDNARLPQALLLAGARLNNNAMTEAGLSTLRWLMGVQTTRAGDFRPLRNETFHKPYQAPLAFDQQPLEAAATIDACWAAYDATGDRTWRAEARRAFAWFFGANELGLSLAAPGGGCFDGLTRYGVNRNQGAESILSLQLSHCEMMLRETPR